MYKILIVIIVLITACTSQENQNDLTTNNSIESESNEIDSVQIWLEQSRIESNQYHRKYQNKWSAGKLKNPHQFPWKIGNKILAYYVAGEDENRPHGNAEDQAEKKLVKNNMPHIVLFLMILHPTTTPPQDVFYQL